MAAQLTKFYTDQGIMPYWRGKMMRATGDVLAASGKKDEAIAKYNEALKLNGLPQEIKDECENAIKAVKAEAK